MTLSLERIRIHGFGPVRGCDLDLREPGIYAIAGVNGAGKSTLLEHGILGALYRETSRGGLKDSAEEKGSTLEAELHNGVPVVCRHVVDGTTKTKRQESVLVLNGQPTDGKVKSFKAKAEEVFPPKDYLLASSFSMQGGVGNFKNLSRDERRAVLSQLLGLERYQRAHERAKERRKAFEAEIAGLQEAIDNRPGHSVEHLEKEIFEAKLRLDDSIKWEREAQQRLDEVRERLARARVDLDAIEEKRRAWEEKQAERERLGKAAGEVSLSVERAQKAQHDLGSLRTVLVDVERVSGEIDEARGQLEGARTELSEVREKGQGVRRELDAVNEEISRLGAILSRADEIREASAKVVVLEEDLATAEKELREAEGDVEVSREAVHAHTAATRDLREASEDLERAESSSEKVQVVPCGGQGEFAECPLFVDATAASGYVPGLRERLVQVAERLVLDAPALLRGAEARLRAAQDRVRCVRSDLERARAAASDLSLLEDAEQSSARLRAKLPPLEEKRGELLELYETHSCAVQGLENNIAAGQAHLSSVCPEGEAALRDKIGRAEALVETLPELVERRNDLVERYGAIEPGDEPSAVQAKTLVALLDTTIESERKAVEEHRSAGDDARGALTRLETELERARGDDEKVAGLQDDIARLHRELADWKVVERCFSKDGLQALLVDAAGPAISDLANGLLDVTMAHFRVRLSTTRMDSTGKKVLEDLDVVVYDSHHGAERSVADLSGGEGVIVTLAIRMALVLHAGAGRAADFMVLDEMDGALDPSNARLYVPMLRKAMAIGGLRQVFFVSHRPECISDADHVITVQDGRVEVTR